MNLPSGEPFENLKVFFDKKRPLHSFWPWKHEQKMNLVLHWFFRYTELAHEHNKVLREAKVEDRAQLYVLHWQIICFKFSHLQKSVEELLFYFQKWGFSFFGGFSCFLQNVFFKTLISWKLFWDWMRAAWKPIKTKKRVFEKCWKIPRSLFFKVKKWGMQKLLRKPQG